MKSVSKSVRADIAQAVTSLRDTAILIRKSEKRLAEIMVEAFAIVETLQEDVEDYNETVGALNELLDGVLEDIDAYVQDRSERWQESEAASRYQAWRDAIENGKIETVEAPAIEPIVVDDLVEGLEAPPLSLDDL